MTVLKNPTETGSTCWNMFQHGKSWIGLLLKMFLYWRYLKLQKFFEVIKSSCHPPRYTPRWSAKQLLLSYKLSGLIGYISHSRKEVDCKTGDTTSSFDHEAAKISSSPKTLFTRHHVIIFAGKRKFFSARVKQTFNSISSYQLQQLLMVSGDAECNPGHDKVKGKRVVCSSCSRTITSSHF